MYIKLLTGGTGHAGTIESGSPRAAQACSGHAAKQVLFICLQGLPGLPFVSIGEY